MQCFPHVDFTRADRPGLISTDQMCSVDKCFTLVLLLSERCHPRLIKSWTVSPRSSTPVCFQSDTLCRERRSLVLYPPVKTLIAMRPLLFNMGHPHAVVLYKLVGANIKLCAVICLHNQQESSTTRGSAAVENRIVGFLVNFIKLTAVEESR